LSLPDVNAQVPDGGVATSKVMQRPTTVPLSVVMIAKVSVKIGAPLVGW